MVERDEGKIGAPATPGQAVERGPMTWRQTLIGIGMFSLVIALFVAIGLKESGALAGKVLGGIGLAMITVGLVANVIHAISSKVKGGRATDGPAGTASRS
jgi:hypothetical protein